MAKAGFLLALSVCAAAALLPARLPAAAQPPSPPAPAPAGLPAQMPPPPPPLRPPTELLRELLAASPAQREELLSRRPPASRAVITNALREYEALSLPARELRLRTLELGWHLDQLLRLTNLASRQARLATVPDTLRQEVLDRLQFWDQEVPPELQRQLLQARRVPPLAPAPTHAPAFSQSDAERARLNAALKRLFDLNREEKARVLRLFTETQRAELSKALRLFETLPQPQRDLCLEGLTKFSALTPEQRREFLKNCEVWKTMSQAERELWRKFVASRLKLPPAPGQPQPRPPSPPGLEPGRRPPPLPPAPPTAPALATNR